MIFVIAFLTIVAAVTLSLYPLLFDKTAEIANAFNIEVKTVRINKLRILLIGSRQLKNNEMSQVMIYKNIVFYAVLLFQIAGIALDLTLNGDFTPLIGVLTLLAIFFGETLRLILLRKFYKQFWLKRRYMNQVYETTKKQVKDLLIHKEVAYKLVRESNRFGYAVGLRINQANKSFSIEMTYVKDFEYAIVFFKKVGKSYMALPITQDEKEMSTDEKIKRFIDKNIK